MSLHLICVAAAVVIDTVEKKIYKSSEITYIINTVMSGFQSRRIAFASASFSMTDIVRQTNDNRILLVFVIHVMSMEF